MHIKHLSIKGLRGFATESKLEFGIPDNKPGSGITTLVGPNNSGKSTIIEAINVFNSRSSPSFSSGRRNIRAGDYIDLIIENTDGERKSIVSQERSSSETRIVNPDTEPAAKNIYVIPSRRYFRPYFPKQESDRSNYILNYDLPEFRGSEINHFAGRLFGIHNQKKEEFNHVLTKVLNPCPDWTIDLTDQGQYYLKFIYDELSHSSDGVGDGIISIFFAISSLFDSNAGDVIVVDEPELSLHPILQKNLMYLFNQYSRDRQIIISTHSPYFIDTESIVNGGRIARVSKDSLDSNIYMLGESTGKKFDRFPKNINNPHVFGLSSKEVFFLQDNIILTEGQEDVILINKLINNLGIALDAKFYGWGIGGAGNMQFFSEVLEDLGFKRVIGILDKDKEYLLESLTEEFDRFHYYCIPANDIRTKPARDACEEVIGLLDENLVLRDEFIDETEHLLDQVKTYFNRSD